MLLSSSSPSSPSIYSLERRKMSENEVTLDYHQHHRYYPLSSFSFIPHLFIGKKDAWDPVIDGKFPLLPLTSRGHHGVIPSLLVVLLLKVLLTTVPVSLLLQILHISSSSTSLTRFLFHLYSFSPSSNAAVDDHDDDFLSHSTTWNRVISRTSIQFTFSFYSL